MGKFDWVKQPPLADSVTFLVDDLGPNGDYGITKDADKINFNRRNLGVDNNLEIGIYTALTTADGISTAVALGRYVTFIQISKDEGEGIMWFMDFRKSLPPDGIRTLFKDIFSERLIEHWITVRDGMFTSYKDADEGLVRLLKVTGQ